MNLLVGEQNLKIRSNRKCKVSFSLVEGNTKIPAHAGPTNTRLRAHLGLVVPKKGDVHMRIANQTVSWKPGKVY